MNLLLFGFKGAGKSHFGKELAKQLHRPFIDTDALISEMGGGKSVRQLYKELGEASFRSLEKKALHQLKNSTNAIIALGGGTPLDPENVTFLQTIGPLIYLKTDPQILKERIFKEELPPFFDKSDPEASFWEMIQEREPLYRSIPARVIDTSLLDEAGVLAALRSFLFLEEPPDGF